MKGATFFICSSFNFVFWFQSTHPWRVRQKYCEYIIEVIKNISIHAPMKGATAQYYNQYKA